MSDGNIMGTGKHMLLLTTGAAAVAIAGVTHCSLYSRKHKAHTRAQAHTCTGTRVLHANASGEDAKKEKMRRKSVIAE